MLRRLILALGLGIAVLALVAAPAVAQEVYPDTPPEEVEGDVVVQTPTDVEQPDDVEVAGDVVTRSLPVTGGDLLGLAAMGAGAIAVGAVLVAQRRRTSV